MWYRALDEGKGGMGEEMGAVNREMGGFPR